MNKKVVLMRSLLVVVYLLLLVVTFVFGRTHTLLIDNKSASDGSYKAVKMMEITVNKDKAVELMSGDRDKWTIKGQRVKLVIDFFDGRESQEFSLRIPLGQDVMLLSVPKLLAGLDGALEPFEN